MIDGQQITVTRETDDGLAGETWRFEVGIAISHPRAIMLMHYSRFTREAPEARPRIVEGTIYNRASAIHVPGWQSDAARGQVWVPPLPDDVELEARQRLSRMVAELPLDAPTLADAQWLAGQRASSRPRWRL